MRPKRPLRIPLVLTCTMLAGAGLSASAACSSSSVPRGLVDAALDSAPLADGAADVTGDVAADSRVVMKDSAPTDAVVDALVKDGAPMDVTVDTSNLPPDEDVVEVVACLALEPDGAPVLTEAGSDIVFNADGDVCPDGDQPLV